MTKTIPCIVALAIGWVAMAQANSEAVSDARVLGMGDNRVAYAFAPAGNPALLSLHGSQQFLWDWPSLAVRIADDRRMVAAAHGEYETEDVMRGASYALKAYGYQIVHTPALFDGQQRFLLRGVQRLSDYAQRADVHASMAMSLPGLRMGVGLWSQTSASAAVTTPASGARQRAIVTTETGLSLARQFAVYGDVSFGLTPKYVRIYTHNRAIADGERGYDENAVRMAERVNFDLGVARRYETGWQLGGILTNILPMTVMPAAGDSFRLMPNVRFGLAYVQGPWTYATDIDFTDQENWVDGAKRRYFGMGTEYAWRFFQLRAGYRHNLAADQAGVATLGAGVQLFGWHVDAALAGNHHELGVTAQVGYRK